MKRIRVTRNSNIEISVAYVSCILGLLYVLCTQYIAYDIVISTCNEEIESMRASNIVCMIVYI